MTTPDSSPLGDAPEADVVEQLTPVADGDEESWADTAQIGEDRGWQASEADLIEQSIPVPEDESEFDR